MIAPRLEATLDALAALSPADVQMAAEWWDSKAANLTTIERDGMLHQRVDARGLLRAESLEGNDVR